jgi:hypothetical protein
MFQKREEASCQSPSLRQLVPRPLLRLRREANAQVVCAQQQQHYLM